jgi:hypothetical protein
LIRVAASAFEYFDGLRKVAFHLRCDLNRIDSIGRRVEVLIDLLVVSLLVQAPMQRVQQVEQRLDRLAI